MLLNKKLYIKAEEKAKITYTVINNNALDTAYFITDILKDPNQLV